MDRLDKMVHALVVVVVIVVDVVFVVAGRTDGIAHQGPAQAVAAWMVPAPRTMSRRRPGRQRRQHQQQQQQQQHQWLSLVRFSFIPWITTMTMTTTTTTTKTTMESSSFDLHMTMSFGGANGIIATQSDDDDKQHHHGRKCMGTSTTTTMTSTTQKTKTPTATTRRAEQICHFVDRLCLQRRQWDTSLSDDQNGGTMITETVVTRDAEHLQQQRTATLDRVSQQHAADCCQEEATTAAVFVAEPLRPETRDEPKRNRRRRPSTTTTSSSFRDISKDFEWINVEPAAAVGASSLIDRQQPRRLALRSLKPVLNATETDVLRQAANNWWASSWCPPPKMNDPDPDHDHRDDDDDDDPQQQQQRPRGTSRFTYQRPGNAEVHISDLGAAAHNIVNRLLLGIIYPLIRAEFDDILSNHQLRIYDALLVRYNATAAIQEAVQSRQRRQGHRRGPHENTNNETDSNGRTAARITVAGAGQPLHRDLGLVSVNILLNDPNEFTGGGTFFEHQMLPHLLNTNGSSMPSPLPASSQNGQSLPSFMIMPLQPGGVGYCLVHPSHERHAGASTRTGVRDILVLFVTANPAPAILTSAHLKQCRAYCEQQANDVTQGQQTLALSAATADTSTSSSSSSSNRLQKKMEVLHCRMAHHRLAVELSPNDGEAYQYLGTAMMEYGDFIGRRNRHEREQGNDDRSGATITTTTTTVTENNLSTELITILKMAIECFRIAAALTPCDSRVYNNLALSMTRLVRLRDDNSNKRVACTEKDEATTTTTIAKSLPSFDNVDDDDDCDSTDIEHAYQTAWRLLAMSQQAGCDVESEFQRVALNYGLFLANNDQFKQAVMVLSHILTTTEMQHQQQQEQQLPGNDQQQVSGNRCIVQDAIRLQRFCRSMIGGE